MADRCVIYTVFIVLQLVLLSLSELSPETRIRENLLREYDRLSGPMSITGEPLNVSVSVLMTSIGPLNEAEMILEMRAIIRMTWQVRVNFLSDTITLFDSRLSAGILQTFIDNNLAKIYKTISWIFERLHVEFHVFFL